MDSGCQNKWKQHQRMTAVVLETMQNRGLHQMLKQGRQPHKRGSGIRLCFLPLLWSLLHATGNNAYSVPQNQQLLPKEQIGRVIFDCKRENEEIAIYNDDIGTLCYWDVEVQWPMCMEGYSLIEDEHTQNIILYILKATDADNGLYMCESTETYFKEYQNNRDSIPILVPPYKLKFECNIYQGRLKISHSTKGELCSWEKTNTIVCHAKYNLTVDYSINDIIFTINEASAEDDGIYICEFSGSRRDVQVYNHNNNLPKYEGLPPNEIIGKVVFGCQRGNNEINIFNEYSDTLCSWEVGLQKAICLEGYRLTEEGKTRSIILNILNATEEDDGLYSCEYRVSGFKTLEYKHNSTVTTSPTEETVPPQNERSLPMESIGRVKFDCKMGSEEITIYNDYIGTLCHWDAEIQQFTCLERYSLTEEEHTQNIILYILKATDADNGLYMCEVDESTRYFIEYQHNRHSVPILDLAYKLKFECNIYQGSLKISHPRKGELCSWNKTNTAACHAKYTLSVDYNITHIIFAINEASGEDDGIYTCEFNGSRRDVKVYNYNNNLSKYKGLPPSEIIGTVVFGCQRRNEDIIIFNEYNYILCSWELGLKQAICMEEYRLTEEENTRNIILNILNATEEDDGLYSCEYRVAGFKTLEYRHNSTPSMNPKEKTGTSTTNSMEEQGTSTKQSMEEWGAATINSMEGPGTATKDSEEERDHQGTMSKEAQIGLGLGVLAIILLTVILLIVCCICKNRVPHDKNKPESITSDARILDERIPLKLTSTKELMKNNKDPTERTHESDMT